MLWASIAVHGHPLEGVMAQMWGDVSLAAHPQKRAFWHLPKILDGRDSKRQVALRVCFGTSLHEPPFLSEHLGALRSVLAPADPFPVPPAPIHSSSAENLLDGRRVNPDCPSSFRHQKTRNLPVSPLSTTGFALPRQTQPGRLLAPPRPIPPSFSRTYPSPLSFPSSSAPPEDWDGPRLPCRARLSSSSPSAWKPSLPAPRTSRSVPT